MPFVAQHKWQVAAGAVVFVAVSYGLSRLILRDKERSDGK
jgi:hypothetical protein